MREILFRGKAINRDKGFHRTSYKNGDWVYGLVTRLFDERFENLPAEMTNVDGTSGIEIDYKTVGQYTGLTDRNRKKIFEGDIVKHMQDDILINYGIVNWDKKNARWAYHTNVMNECFAFYNPKAFEVIGNIHDNPELYPELLRGEK